jgi:hypothetical protein
MKRLSSIAILLLLCSFGAWADLLIGWNVINQPGTQPLQPPAYLAANISTGDITRGPGVTPGGATNAFLASGWTIGGTVGDAVANNDYFSFVITADTGYTLTLTNFSVFLNRSPTGPTNFTLRSSADGFSADIATWVRTGTTAGWESTPLSISGLNSVEFRLYGYQAGSSPGTARVAESGAAGLGPDRALDAGIFGSVVPEPGTAVIYGLGLAALAAIRRDKRRF